MTIEEAAARDVFRYNWWCDACLHYEFGRMLKKYPAAERYWRPLAKEYNEKYYPEAKGE